MKINFEVKYLGQTLKNPIIIGSSGLTGNIESIKLLEKNNAAAVVIKSIFEEQILIEKKELSAQKIGNDFYNTFYNYSKNYSPTHYLKLIEQASKQTNIPIIASIIASASGNWIDFVKQIEQAGAKAIEINFFRMPYDVALNAIEYEKICIDILKAIKKETTLPIALKLGFWGLNISHLIKRIKIEKLAEAIVLFNKQYDLDIDIENNEFIAHNLLSSIDNTMPSLRWIAALKQKTNIPLVANTGVFSGYDIVKQILAGATATQVVSAIYKLGEGYITTMLNQLRDWMIKKEYKKLDHFRGKMSFAKNMDINRFEKQQFIKFYGSY